MMEPGIFDRRTAAIDVGCVSKPPKGRAEILYDVKRQVGVS